MAQCIYESFQHVTTNPPGGPHPDLSVKWNVAFDVGPIGTAYGRLGRPGAQFYADTVLQYTFFGGNAGFVFGMAVNFQANSSNSFVRVYDDSGGNPLTFVYNNNQIYVYNYANTLIANVTSVPFTNTWYYLEAKIIPGASGTGTLIIKVNGVTAFTSTAVTTAPPLHANYISMGFYAAGRPAMWAVDLYINDLTGAEHNDFEGDCAVRVSFPNGAGASTQWTIAGSSPAGTNYQGVNEVQPDYDVTENSSNTVGQIDTFAMQVPSDISVVSGIQVLILARKNSSGSRSIAPVMYQGGTYYVGPTVSLPSSFAYIQWNLGHNPISGNPWTTSDLTSAQFGYKVIS